MNYHAGNTRALILKDMDYQEKDKIITIFTEHEGKIGALVKGVKQSKSSMRGCVQPFCYSELHMHKGKGDLATVTQGQILNFFGDAREDLARTLLCLHMMELLDKSLPDRQPEPRMFRLALAVLELIDSGNYTPLWIRYFELAVIRMLGVPPVLERCVNCGGTAGNSGCLDMELGGLLCQDCARPGPNRLRFQPESLAILKSISSWNPVQVELLQRIKASESARDELEQNLEKYLEFHLEKALIVKKNIRHLQGKK